MVGSCTKNGPMIETRTRSAMKTPPAMATLSRRSRRQAIWPSERPWMTGAPGAVAVASGSR